MKKSFLLLLIGFLIAAPASLMAQSKLDSLLPIRGFCVAAPPKNYVDSFLMFVEKELVPRRVNTLILRVDYGYAFSSHPELRDPNPLERSDVKKVVTRCREWGIRIIPQINLLGHQSWAETLGNLLKKYPQFDETPGVKMPEKYKWPNADSLYCKSYCPQHPDLHKIVFALVDEICEVFETDAFHAGMDEVFYIGDDNCPRCKGKDKARLFADEVTRIRNHLAQSNRELWIWGDRLIDGASTGIGMWEASMNNTHPAIDMIPKDVVICDWHYERADLTGILFAMKGFRVVTCPWRNPELGIQQLDDILRARTQSTPSVRDRLQGMVQTVWSGSPGFIRGFYGPLEPAAKTPWNCFRRVFDNIALLTP